LHGASGGFIKWIKAQPRGKDFLMHRYWQLDDIGHILVPAVCFSKALLRTWRFFFIFRSFDG